MSFARLSAVAAKARRDVSRKVYLVAAIVLFGVEVLIALFVKDSFVRRYGGDVLAVALVYAALRAITSLRMTPAIAVTLAIALAIEVSRAVNLLGMLGLGGNRLARTVLGGAFDWFDLLAYTAGAIVIVLVEQAAPERGA